MQFVEDDIGAVKFYRAGPFGRQAMRHTADNIPRVGDMWNDVACKNGVGVAVLRNNPLGDGDAEEIGDGGHTVLLGNLGNIARWIDAQHLDPGIGETLEKGSVVAGDLDGKSRRLQAARQHSVAEVPAVTVSRRRSAGHPIVMAEEILGRHRFGELQRSAGAASTQHQWDCRQILGQGLAQAIGRRLRTEIEHNIQRAIAADSAGLHGLPKFIGHAASARSRRSDYRTAGD